MSSNERPVKIERLMAESMVTVPHNHTHSIGKKETDLRNKSGLPADLLNKSTDFSGEARVAQVLRWVSTAALQANAGEAPKTGPKNKQTTNPKWTPEVQASVVGQRLLLGTNATDDSSIPNALKNVLTDKKTFDGRISALKIDQGKYTGVDSKSKEQLRIAKQEERHLTQLRAFVTDDSHYQSFVDHSVKELHDQRNSLPDFNPHDLNNADNALKVAKIFKHYEDSEAQMRSMFGTIRESLKTGQALSGPRVEMAPGLPGQHAEQRIVEQVQGNHDTEAMETRKTRGKTLLPEIAPVVARTNTFIQPVVGTTTNTGRNDYYSNPNRTEDGWTGAAIYKVPKLDFDPLHPKRIAAQKRMEEYLNPSTPPSGKVDFIASDKVVVHTPHELTPNTLTLPLAGTKPPCDMCETTEQARHSVVANSGIKSSPFVITRFEDKSNRVGLLFPGQYQNSGDERVQSATTTLLSLHDRAPQAEVNTRKRADSVANFPAIK